MAEQTLQFSHDRFRMVGQVVGESSMTKDERFLMAQRITPETPLPPMKPLFRMLATPCFYRGELVAVCGKAKSGKTTFLSVIMAAAISGKCLEVECYTDATELTDGKAMRVLWIDTEQSQQSTQEIMRDRIIPLATPGAQLDERIFAFNLRGMGYEVRRRMVELAVKAIHPDLVIIDGIKDLMTDINDAVQATLIMEQLMALAKLRNCCIVNVLHQNKSESDRNMRGSIGTELSNKAFEVFQCEFLERHEVFKVSQTLSRKHKMKRELFYCLTEKGLPDSCDPPQEQPRDDLGRWMSSRNAGSYGTFETAALRKVFNDAMEGRTQRRYNELMAVALKKCNVRDAQEYYAMVEQAEQQGIIRKAEHPETHQSWVELTDDGTLPF